MAESLAKGSHVVVVGATSGMGRAIAREFAKAGCNVVVAGRRGDELEIQAKDLAVRYGVNASVCAFEARDFAGHDDFLRACEQALAAPIDGLMLCHGVMPEQEDAERDFDRVRTMFEVNYLSMASLLNRAALHFEAQGHGWICAISSVAGDRGRASNYLYGASKAALSATLSGMRPRLARCGVSVTDVRPGFVDTGLTWGRPGMFLVASPEQVARDVVRGIRKNRAVVYTPFFWAGIMAIIRAIPDFVFRRLSI
jgi:decaprenylphospho-beta-D-erythro-pentofuranosid-2-ulose 2-reductase